MFVDFTWIERYILCSGKIKIMEVFYGEEKDYFDARAVD